MAPSIPPKADYPEVPISWLVGITLIILVIVGLFAFMILRTEILLILFGGIFLGIAIKPTSEWLKRIGFPKEVGAALIFFTFLAALWFFISLVLPLLAMQTVDLAKTFSQGYVEIRQNLIEDSNIVIFQIARAMPEEIFQLGEIGSNQVENGIPSNGNQVSSFLNQVSNTLLGIIFVVFLAINWATEADRFIFTALLLSNKPREFIRETFILVEEKVSKYLTGLGILSLIIGSASYIGYLLLGLPYALVLALFAGIMEMVPVIGPTLGAIPAVIIALSISPGLAIAVIVLTIAIQAVENTWLVSWVMGTSTGVPPFVTLIVLLAFSSLFGIAGALLAIPIAAVVQVLSEAIISQRRSQMDEEIGRDQISSLRYELKELIKDIPQKSLPKDSKIKTEVEQIEDTLEAIALDLDALLKQPRSEEQA